MMRRLLTLIVETLGISLVDEIELEERLRHVRSTVTICLTCATGFSIFNLSMPGNELLGFAELVSVVLFFGPAAFLLNRPERVDVAEKLLLVGALLISTALIVFGGVEGTGLFWVYSVPFLTFFIMGQRRGWYYSLSFFICHTLCILFINPNFSFAYPYSTNVTLHFLLSMGFYVLVAAAFNHARSRFEMQLHQRKAEAEAATLAKSRFLAAASHDLRQPAHALGLFVARLNQLSNDVQTRELVAGVDQSVQALQDMLNAFFDYSRLDSQLTHASPRSFDLGAMFEKLHTSFADTAGNKGLRLRIRPTQACVHSDPVLLQRVLLNLLSNAVQHTPSGTVLLACRKSATPGFVLVQVRDSGIGIAKEHQARVFEEFYQVENPERDRNKGLGLGLSIVERSCNLLNHDISLRSDLGCGTTFTLRLPIGEPADVIPESVSPDPSVVHSLAGMQVMLIEDDELGRSALKGLLQSWGCKLSEAGSAAEALELMDRGHMPDFILTDYRLLGDQSGVEAVRQLRQKAGRDLSACVVSGDTDAHVKSLVAAEGLILLQKPVRPAKLRSVLRHAWSASPAGDPGA